MKFTFESFQNIFRVHGRDKAIAYRESFNTSVVEEETKELTIEQMKELLDENNIKFSSQAKEKGLMKLIEKNELIK